MELKTFEISLNEFKSTLSYMNNKLLDLEKGKIFVIKNLQD